MTAHESAVLEAVVKGMHDLTTKVEVHITKTDLTFEQFRALCDERHGLHPGRLAKIGEEVAQAKGMASFVAKTVPWIISVLSIAIGILLRYV